MEYELEWQEEIQRNAFWEIFQSGKLIKNDEI